MSEIKETDKLVIAAGFENTSTFIFNAISALHSEFDALKAAAESGPSPVKCGGCGSEIQRVEKSVLLFTYLDENTRRFGLNFECPHCYKEVALDFLPIGDAEEVPF